MKKLISLFLILISFGSFSQQTQRELKKVNFSGSGYQLGIQHGKALKSEINKVVKAWKTNTTKSLGRDSESVLKEFFEYSNFEPAIKTWSPNLLEEIRGIADGSDQKFEDIFVLNLLDEFWVYIDDISNHHCSSMGVPANNKNPGYISQNMDLENYTDGFQILMRIKPEGNSPEQLILSYPGLIGLNGLNEKGVGLCVNTIMQLKAAPTGLPVAFVVRHLLSLTQKEEILSFIQDVNHASGQNYLIGIRGEIYDFEASANKVVPFNPNNDNGTVYHTNHPIVNDDMKPWYKNFHPSKNEELNNTNSNSHQRFSSVERHLASKSNINEDVIKKALRSKDNKNNPVCRANNNDGRGFTFASVIMTFTKQPSLQVLAGPPDESEFKTFGFN